MFVYAALALHKYVYIGLTVMELGGIGIYMYAYNPLYDFTMATTMTSLSFQTMQTASALYKYIHLLYMTCAYTLH